MANKCPVPELGEALTPYIRSRDEVADIRTNLHTYLEKNLGLEDHLTNTNINSPPATSALSDAPAGLSGVRKAYWNALKAHQEAQSKYASLKAEIESLSKSTSIKSEPVVEDDVLPLLRQREKQRKLNVIGRAVTSISGDAAAPTNVVLEDFVKNRAGDMPVLPNVSSSRHGYLEEADARMLELKKAILTAKHVLEEHRDEVDGDASPSPQAELYALQQTRNMLINWIEKQLTVIGDAQAANEKPVENLTVDGEDAPIPVSKDEIGQIYGQYLAARKKLLQIIQHPPHHEFDAPTSQTGRLSPSPRTTDKSGALATAMLPYIQPLLEMQSSEDALSSQTAFSRKQLSSAEAETDRLIRRLADESHLVVPGASTGQDWQKASRLASTSIAENVQTRLNAGNRAATSAQEALQNIDSLPKVFI